MGGTVILEKKLELTYARAIFCIVIVIVHAMTGFLNDHHISHIQKMGYSFLQIVLLFATPCFIILSETLLGMRYSTYTPKNFFIKRVKYILVPYLFFGFFVTFKLFIDESTNSSFWEIFFGIVIQGKFFGWFVLVIFQFYILHALFYKILSKANPIYLLLSSFLISFAHSFLMYYNPTYLGLWDKYYPFFNRTIIFYWLFYFVVGFYFGKYYETIISFFKNKIYWFLLIWFLSIFYMAFNFFYLNVYLNESNRFDLLLFSSVSFVFIVYFAKALSKFNLNFILLISEISFFIYLSHQIIVDYISKSLAVFVTQPILFFVLTTIFTLGFCIGLAIILSFIPYVRIVVGRNTLQPMIINNYQLQK